MIHTPAWTQQLANDAGVAQSPAPDLSILILIFNEQENIADPARRPIHFALFFLIGTVSILMGLLAEMIVRTYFESQGRPVYTVRECVNV